jgi:protein-disulfide isomerase
MILGGSIAIAAAATAALATQTTQPAKISDIDRKQIEQIVHDYILAHPEVLSEAADNLNARQVGEVIAKYRSAIETPYAGAWEGAAKGDVIVTEFFDYACGYCRSSLSDIAKLVAADKNVKVVYRELPILSQFSADAAKVSLLAAEKGQYMAYHRALYGAGRVTRDTVIAAANAVGIDRAAVDAALANPAYGAEIKSNIQLARVLQASGTPTFVVGDQVLSGAVGYDALTEAVAKARAK